MTKTFHSNMECLPQNFQGDDIMNKRAEKLLHIIGEVKHKIELLEGYLAWLEEEFKNEVGK